MSRADVEAGVRAGLEAAANVVSCLELLDPSGLSKKEQLRIYDVLGKAEDAIRAIDPAAIAKQFDALRRDLALLQVVAKAAAQLCDNAEEYECDGLGLFAQHGWWEPLHEALDALNESETRRDPQSEIPAAIAATVPERRGKPCEHHTWEREDAVSADGMCPLCLADELAALRARVAELERK